MVSAWYAGALVVAFAASVVGAVVSGATSASDVCLAPETMGANDLKAHQPCIPQVKSGDNDISIEKSKLQSQAKPTQESRTTKDAPVVPRPVSLTKHQRLVSDLVERTLAPRDVFVPSSTDSRRKELPQNDMTVEEIFAHYGLYAVPTPATGNCQYYAVAMSLLDMRFDTPQHTEVLEQMTQLLKEGIAEASLHGYEFEFPHDIRQVILLVNRLDVGEPELATPLSEEESALLFQEYIHGIAQSASATSAFVPPGLWGTEVTLRMMAKLLVQPIFLIIAPSGLQTVPSFQVYEPERTTKGGHQLDSAEEYYFASSKLEGWLSRLQRAYREASPTANPPIVLMYSELHFSRVETQFSNAP
ncbi:uncharacterized protein IUM83_14402 [Phytophthora cinnamomi]|uniref:uncharacterized protein n=1 Tax=Phytophthora cinnamomi TaxID=4785 RepID=UPI00355A361E|nr:hypothetical protein IUM83_14402 [Phytophthora cinnamomi]